MVTVLQLQDLTSTDITDIEAIFTLLLPDKKVGDIPAILKKAQDRVLWLVYRENQKIVGMASMGMYEVVSGFKGWIEDVVVDEKMRGKGIGKALIQEMLERGKQRGLNEIYLFTEDERNAAIALYTQLGFKIKNSKLYHLPL